MAEDKSAQTSGSGNAGVEQPVKLTRAQSFSRATLAFFDTDSRNIGFRGEPKNTADSVLNYTVVPTPAWYPDSFLRSLKRNSYMKLLNAAAITSDIPTRRSDANDGKSLMFYNDNNCGLIQGMVNNVVSTIGSSVMGQITSITSKVDSIAGLFSSNKEQTMQSIISEVADEPFIANQPMVTIYGIHTTEAIRDLLSAIKKCIEVLYSGSESAIKAWFSDEEGSSFVDKIKEVCHEYSIGTLSDFFNLPEYQKLDASEFFDKLVFDRNLRLHSFADAIMRHVVSGSYTMKCELPYIIGNKNNPIITSTGDDSWTGWYYTHNGDEENSNIITSFENVKKYSGLNLVWSEPIDWKINSRSTMVMKRYTPCNLSFYIYNDTIEHLAINLAFMWTFGATTMATTDTVLIRPPYLYTVEVPGSFRFKYCNCSLSISPVGQMRKLSNFNGSGKNTLTTLFTNMFGFEINPKAIEYVPDAYKVEVSFNSILPNTWNFIDSYIRNTERDKPVIGAKLSAKLGTLMNIS